MNNLPEGAEYASNNPINEVPFSLTIEIKISGSFQKEDFDEDMQELRDDIRDSITVFLGDVDSVTIK